MQSSSWEMPSSWTRRLLWLAGRLLGFLLIFLILQVSGALLLRRVPLSFDGPASLLAAATTLIAAVLAGFAMLHWVDRRKLSALGFPLDRPAARWFGWGTAIGVGILTLVVV